jgi:hypothetical protein
VADAAGCGKIQSLFKTTVILLMVMSHGRLAGCSKRPSSKAAADESTGSVASGYVEDAFEGRTKLADFFSSRRLGSFAALEIPQPNLDCLPRNFCPACLRILREDCSCFGILNFKTQNLNDTVIDLNVCHWYPPLAGC